MCRPRVVVVITLERAGRVSVVVLFRSEAAWLQNLFTTETLFFLSFRAIKKVLEVVKSVLSKTADILMALKKKKERKSSAEIHFLCSDVQKKKKKTTLSSRRQRGVFFAAKAQRRFQSIASVLVFWRGRVSAGIR